MGTISAHLARVVAELRNIESHAAWEGVLLTPDNAARLLGISVDEVNVLMREAGWLDESGAAQKGALANGFLHPRKPATSSIFFLRPRGFTTLAGLLAIARASGAPS
jgi:hypothetical protein